MPARRRKRLVVADDERLAAGVRARHDEEELLRLLRATPCRPSRRSPRGRGATGWACTAASRPAPRRRSRCRRAPRRSRRASEAARWDARAIRGGAARPRPPPRSGRRDATLAAITAKGFSSRFLDARSRATARTLRASQARWKPPRPFTATTLPSRIFARAARDHVAGLERLAVLAQEREPRPADGAGVGLRVEAAVGRVRVLARARRAHGEGRHGRARAVVGNAARDGEARAAVRAVDERVAEAAVGGVEELREALRAGGGVGRHRPWPPRRRGLRRWRSPRPAPGASPRARRRPRARAAARRAPRGAGTPRARRARPAPPRARPRRR